MEWLHNKTSIAKDICHPLYNICLPFQGYSGKSHQDQGNAAPTLLLNFGFAWLHLPEFGIQIDLQPGKIILFNANYYHYTTPHPGYKGPNTDHWGISCFFLKKVHNQWQPLKYPKTTLDLHQQFCLMQREDAIKATMQQQLIKAQQYMLNRKPLQNK